MDAEGSERKSVSPLSGILLSILSICFFALGFLVRIICKVEAPWRFCTYCAFAFLPKVFWFGPFVWSKPLGVFALIVRFDKYAKFAASAYFANLLFLCSM